MASVPVASGSFVLMAPLRDDPNYQELAKQALEHPSFRLALQQLQNLYSPATGNGAPEFDHDAFKTAIHEIRGAPHVKDALQKFLPLPEEYFAFFDDFPSVKKKLKTSGGCDKNFLLEFIDALATLKKREDEALVAMKEKEEESPTLLQIAVRGGYVEALKKAKRGGANMGETDNAGRTALMIACAYGQVECAEFLIESKVDVDASDDKGDTALHYAILREKLQCVELLVKHGASLTHKNTDDYDPVEWARALESSHLDEMLKMFGKHAVPQPGNEEGGPTLPTEA